MNQTHPLSELFKELDAIDNSPHFPTTKPINNCRQFVLDLGLMFVSDPNIRWALFEEDGITLIMHSQKSKRQVTFEFALYGDFVNIIQIDEQMKRFECECFIDQIAQLRDAIIWMDQ